MKAIFIAAGEGSRLGSLTKTIPKPLIDVNGKSILERQISLFMKNGISDIVIIRGPHKEQYTFKNVKYIDDDDYKQHEQVGSLMKARRMIKGENLILFADILFEENILHQMLRSSGDIVVSADLDWEKSYEERADNSKFEADKMLIDKDKIVQISAKIPLHQKNKKIAELLGFIKLSPRGSDILIRKYKELEKKHYGKFHDAVSLKNAKLVDVLQELIESNVSITPLLIKNGKWCEIDTPVDLIRARKLFT